MSNLVEPFVNAYTVLPEAPLQTKGFVMKARPIGEIVAHSDTLNLILRMGMQDPEKGYAMRLSEDLNRLSERQLMELRDFLQRKLDTLCNEAEEKVQGLLTQRAAEAEQPELNLGDPGEDDLEIPAFLRRNHGC